MSLGALVNYLPFLRHFVREQDAEDEGDEADDAPLEPARVAIVGAGVGGCCAAYFLRQKSGEALKIDVYERAVVGGRTATFNFQGHVHETGASIIHTSNKYLVDLSKEFGLETKQDVSEVPLGVFDGTKFLFHTGWWKIVNIVRSLWRYGTSLFTLNSTVKLLVSNFVNIYSLQAKGKAYKTVPDLLKAMGGDKMYHLTQVTANEYLTRELQMQGALIRELITGAMYMNYGQGLGVNAATCMVSMAGVEEHSLWAVVGGNRKIPETALSQSGAVLHKSTVSSITRVEQGERVSYSLEATSDNGAKSVEVYDVVIVAAPLYEQSIKFNNFTNTIYTEDIINTTYHRTVAEFIDGEINPAFFGCNDNDRNFPLLILTSEFAEGVSSFPFCSVTINVPSEEPESANVNYTKPLTEDPSRVWKIFTPRPLTSEEKNQMFKKIDAEATVDWLAYPNYSPPETFPPFELDKGVFYVNGIEKIASAMEMSAIGAKNCALLAREYLKNKE